VKKCFPKMLAAAALLPVAVFAQQPPAEGQPGARGGRPDPEKMQQMFDQRFRKADGDGDGALSRAEAEKGMPMLARDFDKIDANGDGKLTPDEIRAAMQKRRAEMKDKGGPGGMGGPGGPGPEGRRPTPEEMKARGDEMFKKADANGDGFLSADEAAKTSPRMARNFKAMDANGDGKLSREEVDQYMASRRREMESRRGGAPK